MKQRLDTVLTERGLCPSRERARAVIMSGVCYVNGQKEDKPGFQVSNDAQIEVRENPVPYVSRGGLKLCRALRVFKVDVSGLSVLDVGASTGGFTDCLLQNGARHVTAVDVGYGQLAWSLREDPRVTNMERTNIRNLTRENLDTPCQMAVIDVSFISLRLVLPVVKALVEPDAPVICLIKPQFEAGREKVGKNGVIRDPEIHLDVLQSFCRNAPECGYWVSALDYSPVKGPKGNIEFLAYLSPETGNAGVERQRMQEVVAAAHENAE